MAMEPSPQTNFKILPLLPSNPLCLFAKLLTVPSPKKAFPNLLSISPYLPFLDL